jgi:hypothetical protein
LDSLVIAYESKIETQDELINVLQTKISLGSELVIAQRVQIVELSTALNKSETKVKRRGQILTGAFVIILVESLLLLI